MIRSRRNPIRIADCGLRIGGKAPCNPQSQCPHPAIRNRQSAIRNPPPRAFSLIEVIASTLIVGLMTVAALNSLGAATRSSESIGNRAVALALADELMAEIIQQPYEEPAQVAVFGRESGEAASPRAGFDDIDDYDNWNQSPPQYRDGAVIPDRSLWRQRVQVRRVSPSDLAQSSATDQGAKLIRVVIEYDGEVLAEQIAIRTNVN